MDERGRVLVTGAGCGLGAAIAARFAADGAAVAVLDLDGAAAGRVADRLGGAAVALEVDVTDEVRVTAALDRLPWLPTTLVNNAGIVRFGPLLDQPSTDWRRVLDVNLTGGFIVAREWARRVRDAGTTGCVVNVSSINGQAPGPNAGAYAASKAGLTMLTAQMALEWGPLGIRTNAVAPGMVDGGMSAPIFADEEMRTLRTGRVPLRRLGREDDIAEAVAWLASEASSYVNGQTLVVDGGVTSSVLAFLPRPRSLDGHGLGDAQGPPAISTGGIDPR